MLDRWTASFFWPALIAAWIGALVLAAGIVVPTALAPAVMPVTKALGALAGIMFVAVMADKPTRAAINSFNRSTAEASSKRSFFQQLFSAEYGDRRLLLVNRLVWFEMVVAIVMGRQDLALLGFVSFAVSGLMLMLGLKRISAS